MPKDLLKSVVWKILSNEIKENILMPLQKEIKFSFVKLIFIKLWILFIHCFSLCLQVIC